MPSVIQLIYLETYLSIRSFIFLNSMDVVGSCRGHYPLWYILPTRKHGINITWVFNESILYRISWNESNQLWRLIFEKGEIKPHGYLIKFVIFVKIELWLLFKRKLRRKSLWYGKFSDNWVSKTSLKNIFEFRKKSWFFSETPNIFKWSFWYPIVRKFTIS